MKKLLPQDLFHLTSEPSQAMELLFYPPVGISHLSPMNPSVHKQRTPDPIEDVTHTPPFKHGLGKHEVAATIKRNQISCHVTVIVSDVIKMIKDRYNFHFISCFSLFSFSFYF